MNDLTTLVVAQLRAQLQRGVPMSLEHQRALVEHVDREAKQAVANVDRLVQAREVYDRLCKEPAHGSIPRPLLVLLIELGRHLGHEGGPG